MLYIHFAIESRWIPHAVPLDTFETTRLSSAGQSAREGLSSQTTGLIQDINSSTNAGTYGPHQPSFLDPLCSSRLTKICATLIFAPASPLRGTASMIRNHGFNLSQSFPRCSLFSRSIWLHFHLGVLVYRSC